MSLSRARWQRPAFALLLLCTLIPGTAPAAPGKITADPPKPRPDAPAVRIRKALNEITNLEFHAQPLNLAVAQLREETKLNFVLDTTTVEGMGITPEESPITLKLQNVKLRSGLRTMLRQFNLSYVVLGDTIVITSNEMAIQRQLQQRINVDLDEEPLDRALKQLAHETFTNLVIDPRVLKEAHAAKLTLQLEDVPLETAVRLMAEMANLKVVRLTNVLFITTRAKAVEMRADPDLFPPATPSPEGVMPAAGPGAAPMPRAPEPIGAAARPSVPLPAPAAPAAPAVPAAAPALPAPG